MYYIIFLLILILGFFESVFERNRIKNVFFYCTAIIFIVIQAYNSWAPDLESYKLQFDFIDEAYVRNALEPIHIFLIEIVKNRGGDFEDFILMYGILIMIPFLYFIKKSSPTPVFVLSIFYIIPFFPDITQIRVFLASAIFFISLQFFNKNKILFYLLYIISVLCHFSLLIMLVFILIRKFSFFKNLKKSNIIILTGAFILTSIPKSVASVIVISINPKYGSYLEGTTTYLGTVGLFLPFFLINNFVINHYNKNKSFIENKVHIKYKKNIPLFMELIMFSNYLLFFQYFIRDFSRITMNLSILSYIYISILLYYGYNEKVKSKIISRFLLKYGVYIWAIITFYITFLMLNNGEYMKIIERTFSNNRFYGM